MTDDRSTTDVLAWLSRFGAFVAARDFDGGRSMFDEGVVAFGTWADVVEGLDHVEATQWRSVWPTIEDFAFDLDGARMLLSPDGQQAVIVTPWGSTGFDEAGAPFDRPGRATLVLRRDGESGGWRCVHTHFSLGRDVPQRSYGRS